MPPAETPPKTWTLAAADPAAVHALAQASGVSEIVARILVGRGMTGADDVRRFLDPDLERDWRSPSSIPGMDGCADEVAEAVRTGARVCVFGDFDADGVTAAALLTLGLRALGADVTPILPHRFDDGYGLTEQAVGRVLEASPGLVVTVDCGISSGIEVRALLDAGVRVVVTDHHEPGENVPVDVPVADPKLPGAPFEGLSGAGVALKLLQAVGERLGDPDGWLDVADIAAIGTVADVVPLLDENRALVAYGLERMRRDPRAGIAALAAASGLEAAALTADRIAYGLAPRINAAGRVADPAHALELLLTDDPERAELLARGLDGYNRLRQSIEAELLEAARVEAARVFVSGDRALVLAGDGWHEGVKGIVAGRLAGAYGIPALLFCIDGDVAHGSGRSVADVDLHAAVSSCSHLLTRFGGHSAAVGVTLPRAGLAAFSECLRGTLAALPAERFVPRVTLDAEVDLRDVSRELAAELAALEPFGHGNARPLLASRGVFMQARKRVGADGGHLKFDAYDGLATMPAIAFRLPGIETAAGIDSAVDLAFHVDVDEWRGRERVQLMVRELGLHVTDVDAPAAELVDQLFADAERILARGDYEGIEDAESFHTKLAGVTFEGRQELVARLASGTPLRLDRQPDNPHDACACALFDPHGGQVGFLNRRLAAALAPVIDRGASYDVTVTDITGGAEGASLGVNVLVSRRLEEGAPEAAAARADRRAQLAALPAAELDEALTRHFIGEQPLHDAQRRALDHLAGGRNCLTVMATGRGKSLIFQLHSARLALAHGRASVFVYPLRALVADQAFHLEDSFADLGLSVRLVTGETPPAGRDELFAALSEGGVDALMTTPEFFERHAERFAGSGRVGFVVIDEAHHVGLARAGNRPAYARMGDALRALGHPTVLAVTATAGNDVAAAIREELAIDEMVLDPSVRDNLGLADRRGMPDKVTHLAAMAARGDKMIVYVNSREQSVRIAQRLRAASPALTHAVAFYNGGVARAARHAIERAFRAGDVRVVVATSAFGEGVNIPDVRHVALFHLPFNRIEFNQMCGRGGRDGEPATVHLLFGEKDARVNEMILEASAPDLDDLRALYATLRDRSASGDEGWIEVTNAELADDVKTRRPRTKLSERGVSAGLGVFRELGFVGGEGAGGYRRLRLLDPPDAKVDIPTASVRYAEGLEEAAGFREFRRWVLDAPAADLLATFNRPILPGT
ncbi:MAG TPA: single-stranded-DNA-specific exonuclease RecJ [Coriobacteriia bacterium]